MEISKKTDYALRMLASLVENPDSSLSVRAVARETGVPYSFARAIQHDLARAGIVENSRGAAGGMRLAVDPEATTLLSLVEAVQGPLAIGCCLAEKDLEGRPVPCERMPECCYAPIWCHAEKMLREYFGSMTISQVVLGGAA